MARKLLIVAAVVLALSLASMFLPARQMNIEGIGQLSFEAKITLSVGSEVAYAAPDTEIRQPDGDISTGSWTTPPLWSKIDEGSATPDGTYIICPGNVNSTGECSVQNPTNAGTYTAVDIKVYARKGRAGGNQRGLDADIRIGGILQGQKTLQANLTASWTEYTQSWTGLSLSQSDMNSLQILFISTGVITGGIGVRRAVWIDYYEVILTYTPPGAACWLCGWDNRVRLTIDQNDIDAPLSNFPVLLYLSTSSGRGDDNLSFIFSEVGANSKKIAVTTNDCTECYVEVEKWDLASQRAWLWVKVPSISDTTDTDLYLYYDGDHDDNTAYVGDSGSRPEVWDSNFAMVQHLGEDATVVHDSTANNNDETNPPPEPPSPGYTRATYNNAGEINGCYSFAVISDNGSRLQMAHSTSLNITDNITLETFVYLDDKSDGKLIVKDDPFDIGGSGCYNLQQELRGADYALELQLDLGGWVRVSYSTYNTGEWLYVVGTYDRQTMRLYLNGVQQATSPQTAAIRSSDIVNLALGNRADDVGILYDLHGLLDEVRISNTARSTAWIRASYESGRDDLIDFGAEETFPADIVNTPSAIDFGLVAEDSSYWSNGSEPTFPLSDNECLFTLTNNSPCLLNISIRATNFICGGDNWTLVLGVPGTNEARMKAGRSGDNSENDMVILETTDKSFISSLGVSDNKCWEIKLETGSFTDTLQKTSTITLTATSA